MKISKNNPIVRLVMSPVGIFLAMCVVYTTIVSVVGLYLYQEELKKERYKLDSFTEQFAKNYVAAKDRATSPIGELARYYRASSHVSIDEFDIVARPYEGARAGDLGKNLELLGFYGSELSDLVPMVRKRDKSRHHLRSEDFDENFVELVWDTASRFEAGGFFTDAPLKNFQAKNDGDQYITFVRLVYYEAEKEILQELGAHGLRGAVFGTLNLSGLLRDTSALKPGYALAKATFSVGRSKGVLFDDASITQNPSEHSISRASIGPVNFEFAVVSTDDLTLWAFAQRHGVRLLTLGAICLMLALSFGFMARQRAGAVRARKSAEQANEQKSRFLATMSHEIRTPLNGILGMSDLVQKGELSAAQRSQLITLNKSAELLNGIINQVLDFAKIESNKLEVSPTEVNLSELIDQLSKNHNVIASSKGVEFVLDFDWGVPRHVVLDDLRLKQILMNLLSNALKFTSKGHVALRISAERTSEEDQVWLRFDVEDTGVGIAEDRLGEVFKAFIQADASTTRNYGGTGLGLAITEQLASLMGGALTVKSVVGEGSTFTLRLPAQTLRRPIEHRREVATVISLRSLVISPNVAMRESLGGNIASIGAAVDKAETLEGAIAAMRHAESQSDAFDIVFLDSEIARDGGAKKLKEALSSEVIVMAVRSSVFAQRSREDDDAEGVDAVLALPAMPEHIAYRAARCFRHSTASSPAAIAAIAKQKPAETTAISVEGAKLLVVEDDRVNQLYVVELLKQNGCDVTIANNGEEAVATVKRESFDLILMDCQMPVMDGFEATRRIKIEMKAGRVEKKPVLALTANAIKGDRERCLEAGMDDYLTKPVREADLLRMLGKWLGPVARPVAAPPEDAVKPAAATADAAAKKDLHAGSSANAATEQPAENSASAPGGAEMSPKAPAGNEQSLTEDRLASASPGVSEQTAADQQASAQAAPEVKAAEEKPTAAEKPADAPASDADKGEKEVDEGEKSDSAAASEPAAKKAPTRRRKSTGASTRTRRSTKSKTRAKKTPPKTAAEETAEPKQTAADTVIESAKAVAVQVEPGPAADAERTDASDGSPVPEAPSPKAPATPATGLIDKAVFAQARESMGSRFSMLVGMFREDAGTHFKAMVECLSRSDFEGCARAAHTLKSSSRMLGASELSGMMAQVEAAGRNPADGATDQIKALLARVKPLLINSIREMDGLLKEGAGELAEAEPVS